jgi:O-antigen ligase
MQGSLLYILLIIFSICLAKIDLKNVYKLSFLCLIFVSISLIFLPMNSVGRVVGTLGEANALGGLVLFLFPLAFFYPPINLKRSFFYRATILVLSFVVIYLTKSSSSMLGLLFECLIISSYFFKFSINKTLVLIGLILVSSLIYTFRDQRVWENRAEIWQTAYFAGLERPILGWGYGNIEVGLKEAAIHNSTTLRFMYVDSSHNIFLDNWVQGGALGLGIFVFIIIASYKKYIAKNRLVEISILTGLVCAACFNPLSIVGLICLWTVIGQSYFFFLDKPAL